MLDELRPPPLAPPAPWQPSRMDRQARAELRKLAKAQQRLLPQVPPCVPGFEIVFEYRPSYFATGDYYDFPERPDGKPAVFIGDGSGHGPTASMIMAMMRALLRTHRALHTQPGPTLDVFGNLLRSLIPSDLFMTGLYLLFEGGDRVSWAAAGQHPPLRIERCGTIPYVDPALVDVPLGIHVDEPVHYSTVTWDLEPGERLLLYTDGLYESYNPHGEKFGRKGLESYVGEARELPLAELVPGLVERVEEHLEGAEFEDDFTVIGIERTVASSE